MTQRKILNKGDMIKLINFKDLAYKDYLASRILINNNLLLQGAILANTAIEKYFKALIIFKGDIFKHTHNIIKLSNSVVHLNNKFLNEENLKFLNIICNAYKTRYFEDLKPGFELELSRQTLLNNLDDIVLRIEGNIVIEPAKPRITIFADDLYNRNPILFLNNKILEPVNNTTDDFKYFIKKRNDKTIVEVFGHTNKNIKQQINNHLPNLIS